MLYPKVRSAMTVNKNAIIAIINIKNLRLGRRLPPAASDLEVVVVAGKPAEVATATAVVIADVMAALVAELDVVLEDPFFLLLDDEALPTRTAWLPSR